MEYRLEMNWDFDGFTGKMFIVRESLLSLVFVSLIASYFLVK